MTPWYLAQVPIAWPRTGCILVFCLTMAVGMDLLAQSDTLPIAKTDIVELFRNYRNERRGMVVKPAIRDSNRVSFSLLPAVSAAAAGRGVVTTLMAAFYLGDKSKTNLSTVYFSPLFTFSGQYMLPIRSYIWTKDNEYAFIGDYRFIKYPQPTYELGAHSDYQAQSLLDFYQVRFYQDAAIEVLPHFVLGLGIQADYYYKINEKEQYVEGPTDWEQYGDSGLVSYTSSGLSLDLIYDSRGNTVNPEKGVYAKMVFRQNQPIYGSNQSWNSIYTDARKYFKLAEQRRQVIAFWGLYWTVVGGKAQYLDLPSIGWDAYARSGRGIQRNRFRSTGMLYGEVEYRVDLTRNGLWGAVVFTNVTAPAVMYTQHYEKAYGSGGFGFRLKFDKRTGSNGLLDFGFSKNYWAWYLGLNEYF